MRCIVMVCAMVLTCMNMVWAQVTVDFSVDNREGCGNLQAQFTDLSASSAGPIVSWLWDLGDGVSSEVSTPGRIFTEPGRYEICLTVTDNAGNKATKCKPDHIAVYELPRVDFTASEIAGCTPLMVTFTNMSIGENDITNLIWDLGGENGVLVGGLELNSVEGVYRTPDAYGISLTIRDDKGCTASLSRPGLVKVSSLKIPKVSANEPLGCQAPHQTDFQISGLLPDVLYTWDFGNGEVYIGSDPPTQSFTESGAFDLTVTAMDTLTGCRDTFEFPAVVNVGLSATPTVNFDTSCVGSYFKFEDPTLTGLESVEWDFGDSTYSDKPSPSHRYVDPGCYTVTLKKSISGCEAQRSLDQCIEVVERPNLEVESDRLGTCVLPARFDLGVTTPGVDRVEWYVGDSAGPVKSELITIVSDTNGRIPFLTRARYLPGCILEYSDTLYVGKMELNLPEISPAGCVTTRQKLRKPLTEGFNLVEWEWSAYTDPVQSSSDETPRFDVIDPGEFDVQLIAVSEDGCKDTILAPSYLRGGFPPEFVMGADIISTCSDTTIQFIAAFTTPYDELQWSFGDGVVSGEIAPGHVYTDTGTFTIVLSASYNGCTSVDSMINHVEIFGPISKFDARVDCGSLQLELVDRSTAADQVSYEVTQNGLMVASSNQRDAILSLPMNGGYEVIQYTENFITGCEDIHRDSVFAGPIAIDVSFSTAAGCAPLSTSVINSSRNIDTWQWQVPGAIIDNDTLVQPKLTFNNPGVYRVFRVTVTDDNGCTETFALEDTILVGALSPDLGDSTYVGCPGGVFTLGLLAEPAVPIVSWEWTVGQGSFSSTDDTPEFLLAEPGYYDVGLSIMDSMGCTSSSSADSMLHVVTADLDFIGDTVTCVGANSQFRIKTPVDGMQYYWDFGTGTAVEGVKSGHVFDSLGVYEVCISVYGMTGCDSVRCKTVEVVQPSAGFSVDTQYSSCPPLIVSFDNSSFGATSFEWFFGDSSGMSASEAPVHVYTEPGTYGVTLIASLTSQCADTLFVSDLIELEGPIGEFEYAISDECLPVEVFFEGTSAEEYQYIWDFGNGILDSTEIRVRQDTVTVSFQSRGSFFPRLILIDTLNCHRALVGNDSIYVKGNFLEAGRDTNICAGEDVFLAPEVLGGEVNWQSHPLIADTMSLTQSVAPDTTTWFVISGYEGSCFGSDTVRVQVERAVEIRAEDAQLCIGDTIVLTASGSADIYEWSSGNGIPIQYGAETSVVVAPDSTTIFEVIGYRSTCKPDTIIIHVGVFGDFNYHLPGRAVIFAGEQYKLPLSLDDGEVDVSWTPSTAVDCPTCVNATVTADAATMLYLTLTEPVLGCRIVDSIDLRFPRSCSDDFAHIPNVFSPNGDGVNDFISVETRKYLEPFDFSVYDRWGNEIFRSKDIDFQWHGEHAGQVVSPGVYVYALSLTCPMDGKPVLVTGDITVIR